MPGSDARGAPVCRGCPTGPDWRDGTAPGAYRNDRTLGAWHGPARSGRRSADDRRRDRSRETCVNGVPLVVPSCCPALPVFAVPLLLPFAVDFLALGPLAPDSWPQPAAQVCRRLLLSLIFQPVREDQPGSQVAWILRQSLAEAQHGRVARERVEGQAQRLADLLGESAQRLAS